MGQTKSVCTLADLRKLEVINLCDGSRLGYICDAEIDLCAGCLTAIMVPQKIDFWEWFRKDGKRYCRIPWCDIECIGDDTVLVRFQGGIK